MEITITIIILVVAFEIVRIDGDGEDHMGLFRC